MLFLPEEYRRIRIFSFAFQDLAALLARKILAVSVMKEEEAMHIAKEEVPVKLTAPGVTVRQQTEFGDATGYGKISGEYFSLPAGLDISPLLQGLEGNLCQSPHWGYVLEGKLTATYADGTKEVTCKNDLFYWPPGHTVRVEENAELVLFSPQHEHTVVMNHMMAKMNGS